MSSLKKKTPSHTQVHVYPETVTESVSYWVIWAEAIWTLFTLFSGVLLRKGTRVSEVARDKYVTENELSLTCFHYFYI